MTQELPSQNTKKKRDRHFYHKIIPWIAALSALWLCLRLGLLLHSVWAFTTDDAYITLRYARHLAEGHGILWNLGEPPVEGYSNFLYLLLAAASIKLGFDPVNALKILGASSLLASCLLIYLLARRWLGQPGALLPVALFTAFPGATMWAVSGLETAAYLLFGLLAIWLFFKGTEASRLGIRPVGFWPEPSAHRPYSDPVDPAHIIPDSSASEPINPPLKTSLNRRSTYYFGACGLVLCLCALTRLEGPILAATLAALLVIVGLWRHIRTQKDPENLALAEQPAWRALAMLLLFFGLPWALYFMWRWQYFGRFLPNTYYCKASSPGEPWALLRGYLRDSILLIVPALVFPWPRLDIRAAALFSIIVAYTLILYGADTTIAYGFRLAMLPFALLCILASVSVLSWLKRLLANIPRDTLALALLLALLIAMGPLTKSRHKLNAHATQYAGRMAMRAELGHWLREHLGPHGSFIVGDAGIIPYSARIKTLDAYCLNNRAFTNPQIAKNPARVVEWLFEQEPDAIVMPSNSPTRLQPHTYLDIFPTLADDPQFTRDYHLEKTFEDTRGRFHYWLYLRNPPAP